MQPGLFLLRLLALLLQVQSLPQGTFTAVVPSRYTAAESPGGITPFTGNGSRQQMIYPASDLLSVLPRGGVITEIAFRADGTTRGADGVVVPALEIHMSTTKSSPFAPSFKFAENVGPDDTVVMPRGSLEWNVTLNNSPPNPFSLRMPLTHPFSYNPANGNLLVELFVYQGSGVGTAVDSAAGDALNVAGPIGSPGPLEPFPLGSAGVLQITYFPIPEPLSTNLIGFGLLLILVKKADKWQR
jgi:hypothetical protein